MSAPEEGLRDPLPRTKAIEPFTGGVAMRLTRRVNRAAVKAIQVGAGNLGGFVDAKALGREKVRHDTTKTATGVAVGAKGGHWRTSSLREGKMTRRYLKIAVSKTAPF